MLNDLFRSFFDDIVKRMNKDELNFQIKLMGILNNVMGAETKIENITFQTRRTERVHKREANYAFLFLIMPILRNKKVLDLFCGTNSIKLFSAQNNLNATVTGVDNGSTNTERDIDVDVINLPDVLTAAGQFDIITSFGGTESENYFDDYHYLKDNGLLIHGYSNEHFKEHIELQLCEDKEVKRDQRMEVLLNYFRPITRVNVEKISLIIDWPDQTQPIEHQVDMVYFIFRKRPLDIEY
ncbi:MAG: hypothetical protein WCP03_00415 [Candidatus Saccharibacteria bacterium]